MAEARVGEAAVRPYRWALIGALVLCSSAMLWYGFTIGVLLPDISEDLGLRPAEEGWLSSAFYFGQLLLTLPVALNGSDAVSAAFSASGVRGARLDPVRHHPGQDGRALSDHVAGRPRLLRRRRGQAGMHGSDGMSRLHAILHRLRGEDRRADRSRRSFPGCPG